MNKLLLLAALLLAQTAFAQYPFTWPGYKPPAKHSRLAAVATVFYQKVFYLKPPPYDSVWYTYSGSCLWNKDIEDWAYDEKNSYSQRVINTYKDGRLVSAEQMAKTANGLKPEERSYYRYYFDGKLKEIEFRGYVREHYTYDSAGRKTQMITPDVRQQYLYNADGLLEFVEYYNLNLNGAKGLVDSLTYQNGKIRSYKMVTPDTVYYKQLFFSYAGDVFDSVYEVRSDYRRRFDTTLYAFQYSTDGSTDTIIFSQISGGQAFPYQRRITTYNQYHEPLTEDLQYVSYFTKGWEYEKQDRYYYYGTGSNTIAGPARKTASEPDFGLFPVPAKGEMTIEISPIAPGSQLQFSIFNEQGQRMQQWQRTSERAAFLETIDISVLLDGNYIMEVQIPDGRLKKRFVVVR